MDSVPLSNQLNVHHVCVLIQCACTCCMSINCICMHIQCTCTYVYVHECTFRLVFGGSILHTLIQSRKTKHQQNHQLLHTLSLVNCYIQRYMYTCALGHIYVHVCTFICIMYVL